MKVLYICLAGDEQPEDISLNPRRYGGSAAVPRALRNFSDIDFWYAGSPSAASSFTEKEDKSKFINLTPDQRIALSNYVEVQSIIPDADSFDLIFHSATRVYFNTKVKQLVWGVGVHEEYHPYHQHVALFAPKHQFPHFNNVPHQYNFILGTDLPGFQKYEKEDFGLVVANQRSWLQSAALAKLCNYFAIPCIFAGPIDKDYEYEFLSNIDGKNTRYLGEISNQQKVELNQKARCVFQLHLNPTCFTLAGKEGLAYGTPVIASAVGEWADKITNGVNGYIINDATDIVKLYNLCKNHDQYLCYNFVKENYSREMMIDSLKKVFKLVVDSIE